MSSFGKKIRDPRTVTRNPDPNKNEAQDLVIKFTIESLQTDSCKN